MKKIVACIGYIAFASALAAGPAQAAPLTTGVWSALPAPNEDGTPFFDKPSFDGPGCGIAYLITSANTCGQTGLNLSGVDYLHDGANNAVSFGFEDANGDFQFEFEITALSGSNVLEWYDLDSAATGVIFDGSQGAGATTTVLLPERFGFRYTATGIGPYNSTGVGFDQMALLRYGTPGDFTYILGIEDLLLSGVSDGDHNDGVYRFNLKPVPEPTSMILLGTGLLGAAWRARRQRAAQK